MNDSYDDERVLRRLLAEVFVARVAHRILRRRFVVQVAQGAAVVGFVMAAAALSPFLMTAADWIATAPAVLATDTDTLLGPPTGLILSALAGAFVLTRLVTSD
jgi:hypothetical protein